MSLKAAQIQAFKPTDTPYRKFDGRGLYLEVRPNGSKLWYFKYRFLGSEKRLSFGTFPEVSLAQARHRCDDARRLINAGDEATSQRSFVAAVTFASQAAARKHRLDGIHVPR